MISWFALALALQHDMHAGHEMAPPPDPFSLFNHHLAGLLVILVAVFTYLEESRFGTTHRWVKYLWPLPLLAVATFVLLRSDSFVTLHWSEWLPDTEAVQHKLFGLLALAIGGIELLRRAGQLQHPAWGYVFYAGAFIGGLFLLFHAGVQHSHIIHQQHIGMGTAAVAIAVAKTWSDFQKHSPWLRLYLVPALFVVLGLQLALYVE